MPTNSVYLFRIFECDTGFGIDGSVEVLRADYLSQCWGTEHYAMIAYALVMIFVYPIGTPVLFGLVMFMQRRTLQRLRRAERLLANESAN